MKVRLEIDLGENTVDEVDFTPEQLAAALDHELNKFNEWFASAGNQPLIHMERSILKTYMAWKLLYEDSALFRTVDAKDGMDTETGERTDG